MISVEEVIALYTERRQALMSVHTQMRELQAAVNGEMDLPLPELDRSERPMVANLISQGLDQNAMRVASTVPDVRFPVLRPGIASSEERARNRRMAVLGWWHMNRLNLLQRRRARWLLGYATAPVIIQPDEKRGIPQWVEWNPLATFWPPGAWGLTPPDCILTFTQTLRWLKARYPDEVARIEKGPRPSLDDRFDILRYCDDQEDFLVLLGRNADGGPWTGAQNLHGPAGGGARYLILGERAETRTGLCPAVLPARITLDRLQGQFDAVVPLFWSQAMMMALEVIAVKRGIFADEWIVSRPNEQAQIIQEADGLTGQRGLIQGGEIRAQNIQPGMQTYPTIDRIERAMRLAGGVPAEFGGESPSNVRTGRRGAQVLSSSVDYPIQEAQEVLAASLEEENTRAIAVAKAFFPGKRSFWFSWNGKGHEADYDTAETFETSEHTVRYSLPGSSMNDLVIGGGQRIGMGAMSTRSWMEMDPMVEDPDREENQILAEGLQRAFMQAIQTQAAQGALAPIDLAAITRSVVAKNLPLYEAVELAQAAAQERQASMAAEGEPAGPVPEGAPEAQPGLTPAPTAQAPEAIPQGPASMSNLSALLTSLRKPTMTTAGG